jgi:hypothetical protein
MLSATPGASAPSSPRGERAADGGVADCDGIRARAREALALAYGVGEAEGRSAERAVFNRAVRRSGAGGDPCTWKSPVFAACYKAGLAYALCNSERALRMGVPPREVADRPPRDLAPEVWDPVHADYEARSKRTSDSLRLEPNTEMFTCRRCRSKRCFFYEVQTRSADEPMTVFVTCCDCKHQMRVG